MKIAYPLSLALLLHILALSFVAIRFNAPAAGFQHEFYFWGGVVRKEELSPGKRYSSGAGEDAGIQTVILDHGPMAWFRGLGIDKPATQQNQRTPLPLPIKFSGPRVTIDEENHRSVSQGLGDIPAPIPVKLRYPRP